MNYKHLYKNENANKLLKLDSKGESIILSNIEDHSTELRNIDRVHIRKISSNKHDTNTLRSNDLQVNDLKTNCHKSLKIKSSEIHANKIFTNVLQASLYKIQKLTTNVASLKRLNLKPISVQEREELTTPRSGDLVCIYNEAGEYLSVYLNNQWCIITTLNKRN